MVDENQPQLPADDFPQESTPEPGIMISNKFYDVLKPIASLYWPLLLAFYSTLSQIWKWPLEAQIVGTLGAIQVLLGGLVVVSSKVYANSDAKYQGVVEVDELGNVHNVIGKAATVPSGAKDAVFKITNV